MKKNFKNINKDIVKKLVDYSNEIAILYNELYTLEINNNKNSKEYYELIELIKYVKNLEQECYNSIPIDYYGEYLEYFSIFEESCSNVKSNTNKPLFSEAKTCLIVRIMSTLDFYIEDFYDETLENIDDEIISVEKLFDSIDVTDEIELANALYKFEDEAMNRAVIFLDDFIDDIDDIKLKNELIKIKYVNAFTNPAIEDSYLLRNMELNLEMIVPDDYKDYSDILDTAYNHSKLQMKTLLKDNAYNNKKKFMVDLALLKAYLCFISSEDILKLIDKLHSKKSKNSSFDKVKTKVINEMKDTLNKFSN